MTEETEKDMMETGVTCFFCVNWIRFCFSLLRLQKISSYHASTQTYLILETLGNYN